MYIPNEKRIEYLIRRRFPYESVLVRSDRIRGVSFERRKAIGDKVAAYEAELKEKPFSDLLALYEQEKAKEAQELKAKAAQEEDQRFFNQPDAEADFEYWSKATYWTLDEAIALAFGRAPEVVRWERVKPLTKISPFAKEYERVRELVLRAKAWNQLYEPVLPSLFLAWAKRNELEVADKLVQQVEKRGVVIADWKDLYDKLLEEYEQSTKRFGQLYEELQKIKSVRKNEQLLTRSHYWQSLEQKALQAVNGFPAWRRPQRKVQKTGNLQGWLTGTIGADNREAEILKKVLSDFFKELK